RRAGAARARGRHGARDRQAGPHGALAATRARRGRGPCRPADEPGDRGLTLIAIARLGRPHGVAGEIYVDHCPLTPAQLLAMGPLEWRSARGAAQVLTPKRARAALERLLVTFDGVASRESAATLVNGTL